MAVMSLKCRLLQLAALCFFWPLAASMHQLPGVIMLDYLSFNKTVGRFPYALIKFDSVFPHADKQLTFSALALELSEIQDVLVAEVQFSDSDKANDVLRTRFDMDRGQYPEVMLFKTDKKTGAIVEETFYGAEFSTDAMRKFLKHKTGMHLALPGCLKEFDDLAGDFARNSAKGKDRQKILERAVKKLDAIEDDGDRAIASKYVKLMETALGTEGLAALRREEARIEKLLQEKMSPKKLEELHRTKNVLKSFDSAITMDHRRDEL